VNLRLLKRRAEMLDAVSTGFHPSAVVGQLAGKYGVSERCLWSDWERRHWKATMEYHKTKDILHVMQLLGHRNIKNTLVYTQLVNFENDDYHSATAKTIEEATKLIDTGFEYVCTHNNTMLFRKRK
jgi:hypothetical protein